MNGLEGMTIGKYRVIEKLGRGGMATVYKAYHPRLDRYVAIKALHRHLYEGENFLERFQQEARAVAALRHPHIVQVYDFDVHEDTYFMVMEYIGGGTLKAKMESLSREGKTLPLEEAVKYFQQVASALDFAHQKGMIHRDMKPANVLINAEGDALLTDFGIARLLSQDSTNLTATGTLIGTPAYMSPEQGKGVRELTPASDIYSLGVILYELLTGQVPYDADTPIAIIHKHIHEPLPFPHQINPDIPAGLERVILKGLAKEPEDRYQSAVEMSRAVDLALQELSASPADQETRVMVPRSQETVVAAPESPAEQPIPVGFDFQETVIDEEERCPLPEASFPQKKKRSALPLVLGGLGAVGLIAICLVGGFIVLNNLPGRNGEDNAPAVGLQKDPTATPMLPTPRSSPTAAGFPSPTPEVEIVVGEEPIIIWMHKEEDQYVPAGTPLQLGAGWLCSSEKYVYDFLDAVTTSGSLDGETLFGMNSAWSEPMEHENGYVTYFLFPLDDLPPGAYEVEILVTLDQTILDGFDSDEDGELDTYAGILWNLRKVIIVEE